MLKSILKISRVRALEYDKTFHKKFANICSFEDNNNKDEFVMAWEIGVQVASVHTKMHQILLPQ